MRNIDLTKELTNAKTRASGWSERNLLALATAITQKAKGSRWDWDADAGEEWGRIVRDNKIVALLWVRGPFAFIDESWCDVLQQIFEVHGIFVERVVDWEAKTYSLELAAVQGLFGKAILSDAVDLGSFSASELWWATI